MDWLILIWTTRPFHVALAPLLQMQHPLVSAPTLSQQSEAERRIELLHQSLRFSAQPWRGLSLPHCLSSWQQRGGHKSFYRSCASLCSRSIPSSPPPPVLAFNRLQQSPPPLCTLCLPTLPHSFFPAAAQVKHCDVREGGGLLTSDGGGAPDK